LCLAHSIIALSIVILVKRFTIEERNLECVKRAMPALAVDQLLARKSGRRYREIKGAGITTIYRLTARDS
jgi:hypothetical protein